MSGNPWLDDDDSLARGKPNRWLDEEEDFDPTRDESSYFRQVVRQKETDIVASTERSLRLIEESEQIGASTGEELIRQGEVLKRTEKRVDQMEEDLKESDRHIQSIKSLWGAFTNKFRKEPAPRPVTTYSNEQPNSKLEAAVTSVKAASYQADDYESHPVLARQQQSRQQFQKTESEAKNERMRQVDDNLDMMAGGLSRLKDLSLGLGAEIDAQDKVITRLGSKVQRVDDKTHATNKKLIKLNNS